MPDLTVWPTDGADGSVSSEARWRKMARLWVPSGVDMTPLGVGGGAGALAPTLAAGPTINVAAGSCWLDGHYAELATPTSVPATANGLLVVRFTPADNHAELLWRDAAVTPTQTLTTWELVIASMTAGAITDQRRAVMLGGINPVPACILQLATAVAIPNGTSAVAFPAGTEVYDPLNMHDPVTNNSRITVQSRGLYGVDGYQIWTASNGGQYRMLYLNANGVSFAQQLNAVVVASPNSTSNAQSAAGHVVLNPGDYVQLALTQDTGAALNLTAARLSLVYLGPAT